MSDNIIGIRKPDFSNMLKVLDRKKPDRHTLAEFFISSEKIIETLTSGKVYDARDPMSAYYRQCDAFMNAGYDYVSMHVPGYGLYTGNTEKKKTRSLNEYRSITCREAYNKYKWPEISNGQFGILDRITGYVPEGMKIIVKQPFSILGGTISLTGYDNLCFMLYDDERLAADIIAAIGESLLEYHKAAVKYNGVGACLINDDWGDNNQTRLSPAHLRKYIFPWYKRIVREIHMAGKPAILHSCGKLTEVIDDIADDMQFDGYHSYSDNIMPVEEFYSRYGSRIAVLGGIDIDFMCRETPDRIFGRSREMLRISTAKGGYALGTGNSICDYMPEENYFAMIRAAVGENI